MEWQNIALIIVTILLIISGGFIKRLVTALHELVEAFDEALKDDKIDRDEWACIIRKGENAFAILADIASLAALRKGK